MTGRVLVVCSGNTCRSPFVERVLRARLAAAGADVEVGSAGTDAVDGTAMSLATRELLVAHGGDPRGFVARRLTARLLDDAVLVLALTREHRERARALRPDSATVVLGALPRVLAGTLVPEAGSSSERLAAVAAAVRAATGADDPGEDVPDPFGTGPDGYADAAALMLPPTLLLARALLPPRSLPRSLPRSPSQ